jgi:hypothetical protein
MTCIRANLLEREGTWDPQFFCGPIAPLLNGATTQALHRTSAQIIEGWRGTASGHTQEHRNVEPQPLYRMSNVDELELRLGPEHCVIAVSLHSRSAKTTCCCRRWSRARV